MCRRDLRLRDRGVAARSPCLRPDNVFLLAPRLSHRWRSRVVVVSPLQNMRALTIYVVLDVVGGENTGRLVEFSLKTGIAPCHGNECF